MLANPVWLARWGVTGRPWLASPVTVLVLGGLLPVLISVRDDLAGLVHQALQPAHVSVWVSHRD
jgi:hypothetical protein